MGLTRRLLIRRCLLSQKFRFISCHTLKQPPLLSCHLVKSHVGDQINQVLLEVPITITIDDLLELFREVIELLASARNLVLSQLLFVERDPVLAAE